MPIFNRFIRDNVGNLSPSGLELSGAFFEIEVHVLPAIAQALTNQNQPIPPAIAGFALIDTGASKSCVHDSVLQQLNLNPIGITNAGTAGGLIQRNIYAAPLVFPG